MPTMEKKSVTVTLEQAQFICQKVTSGEYASDSEVIRDALRVLAERDRAVEAWLHNTVAETYDRVEAGNGTFYSIDQARELLETRLQVPA